MLKSDLLCHEVMTHVPYNREANFYLPRFFKLNYKHFVNHQLTLYTIFKTWTKMFMISPRNTTDPKGYDTKTNDVTAFFNVFMSKGHHLLINETRKDLS